MKSVLLNMLTIGLVGILFPILGHSANPRDCLSRELAAECRQCVADACAEELQKLDEEVGYIEAKKEFDAARERFATDKSSEASAELERGKRKMDAVRQLRTSLFKNSPCTVEGEKIKANCDKKR